ncbi:MAG: hypothetical protein HYW63_04220 [Candidatus Levybacteria bacterium]|nr:hypothetical protein [Candidatus Levybacteria bacterium]
METENNDGKFNRNGYRWDGAAPGSPQTATDGWHGDGYIAARPNDDLRVFFANGYLDAPEVVYNVNFTTTGTYFVYLRSSGPDAKSDSAHVGLDGALNGSMALYFIGEGGATSNWKWRSNNNDGTRTKINVSTPGIHTFHIFMREDGTRIDRIRLSTNKDWVANPNDSAKGPDESPRGTF